MKTLSGQPETAASSVGNLAILLGMAQVSCGLSQMQIDCAIDSIYVLGRAAGVDESFIRQAVGKPNCDRNND